MTTKTETKLTDPSLETLAQLFKEQLRLLGRLLLALRNMTPLATPAPELLLEPADTEALRPRVAYERDEEVAATD
jgi:hypothetical protein